MGEADERTWIIAKDGSSVLKISKVGWVSKDERNISRKADQRLGSGTGYIKNTNNINGSNRSKSTDSRKSGKEIRG